MADIVLLLEDEQDLASLVTEILTEEGYQVMHVTEVPQLLELAARYSPCVALIDGKSPTHFDLWQLGPQLQDLGVPAVAFTAHASAEQEFQKDTRGFVGVIAKPFDAQEFIDVVNSVCWQDHRVTSLTELPAG